MPWRTAAHFWITDWMTEGEIAAAGIWERVREREGRVKVGFRTASFDGYLRWWSLMIEWSFSTVWVSSGVKDGEAGVVTVAAADSSFSWSWC